MLIYASIRKVVRSNIDTSG